MSTATYWGPAMSSAQYAVFQFDVETMVMSGERLLVFDSLSEAQQYCKATVAARPSIGCRILDHAGKTVQTFSDDRVYDKNHGAPAAKRNVLLGCALLSTGAGLVALDAWLGWRLVFGVLLGVRFLWAGCVKTIDGAAFLMSDLNSGQ